MRLQTTRLLGVLALGGVMLTSTACLPNMGGDSDRQAACDNIVRELNELPSRATQQLGNPSAMIQAYEETANNIRTEGRKAGGDVQEAAENVASDLESLAQTIRNASNGNLTMPDVNKITESGNKLRAACTG
ncbi:hypothetical protein [Thermomonospora catenispora]|uniref:hypothetical protein n=1 Tax=Thermomonospora catenispora TaxID=2493090 RepID=UPI0011217AD6|nr:hypothetical protein [Thermomonospora catenispora]TNY38094.1 hypothetical protein EIO00_03450 [Thermomonospora catenispora]